MFVEHRHASVLPMSRKARCVQSQEQWKNPQAVECKAPSFQDIASVLEKRKEHSHVPT